jgi:hypothetical protein
MRLEHFDDHAKITYGRQVFDEWFSLRFIPAASDALIMCPVGTGKTFVATALGHAAIRRRHSVHFGFLPPAPPRTMLDLVDAWTSEHTMTA